MGVVTSPEAVWVRRITASWIRENVNLVLLGNISWTILFIYPLSELQVVTSNSVCIEWVLSLQLTKRAILWMSAFLPSSQAAIFKKVVTSPAVVRVKRGYNGVDPRNSNSLVLGELRDNSVCIEWVLSSRSKFIIEQVS